MAFAELRRSLDSFLFLLPVACVANDFLADFA